MFEQPPFDAGRGSASGPADFKTGAAPAPPPLDREHGIRQAGAGGAADADFTSEIKILMLEDSEFDAELTERELRHGDLCFLSRRVMTRDDFEREMTAFKPHIVLADYALPSYDGLSALAFVLERLPLIPFIFVSGTIGEEFVSAVSVKNGLAERTTHGPGRVAVTGYTSEEYDKDPYLWYRMVHEEDRSGVTAQARAILVKAGADQPGQQRRKVHARRGERAGCRTLDEGRGTTDEGRIRSSVPRPSERSKRSSLVPRNLSHRLRHRYRG